MTPPADPPSADARTAQTRTGQIGSAGAATPDARAVRPENPLRSLGRDLGLGLLLCILLVLLLLFASGPSGETQGFIYVDF